MLSNLSIIIPVVDLDINSALRSTSTVNVEVERLPVRAAGLAGSCLKRTLLKSLTDDLRLVEKDPIGDIRRVVVGDSGRGVWW